MATKKAASTKKPKTATAKKQTTTVTTVKAASTTTKRPASNRSKLASPLLGSLVAEFIGTFMLAAIAIAVSGNSLFVGFALVAIVLTIGAMSGAHVNPLITIGAWVTRKISSKRAAGYVVAQVLGAMLALVVMTAYAGLVDTPDPQAAMLGAQQGLFEVAPIHGDNKAVWYVFFAELMGAAIFAFAVSSAMREKKDRTAQALTVGLGLFAALTIAGAAAALAQAHTVLNPALALSLQAIEWPIKDMFSILVYIISPILGGAIGFFLYDTLNETEETL